MTSASSSSAALQGMWPEDIAYFIADEIILLTGKTQVTAASLLDRGLFDLGVQSCDLPVLLESVRKRFGIELDVLTIFNYPTARKLANFISTQG